MTTKEAVALLERYSNYDGIGIPNLAGCKEAMRVAVDALKEICPELAESEDERIRTELLSSFKGIMADSDEDELWYGLPYNDIIAWLEKQEKEADERLERVEQFRKEVQELGEEMASLRKKIYGDEQKEQKPLKVGANAYFTPEQKPAECLRAERNGWYVCIKDYYRGGKKQSSVGDLVQAKGGMYIMGEEDISEWFRRAYYEEVRDAFEPNTDTNIPEKYTEWSEEDKGILLSIKCVIDSVWHNFDYDCSKEELEGMWNWLDTLWQRVEYPQQKPEWSEEDETRLTNTLIMLKEYAIHHYSKDDVEKSVDWLENRVKFLRPQQRQEWSEEDETYLQDALWCIEQAEKVAKDEGDMGACWSARRWLKSLRPQPKQNDVITPNKEFFQWIYDRLVNVHNEDPNVDYMISFKKRIEESSWKPSEEQMEVDLEKEIEKYFKGWTETDEGIACHYQYVDLNTCHGIAHHFYELGQQEMRHRIMNPEYNAKVVERLKSEYPIIKEK